MGSANSFFPTHRLSHRREKLFQVGVMASFQAFQNPPPPAQETLTENQTGSRGAARMGGGGGRVGQGHI